MKDYLSLAHERRIK